LIFTVYRQLFVKHDFEGLKNEFLNQFSTSNFAYLLIVFLLMFLNWFLEIIRWRNLVNIFHPLRFKKATAAIMMGVTMGMISPQRIGEYAGRLLVVPSDKNWLSVKANFYTSLSLNFVILLCGILALYTYLSSNINFLNLSGITILAAGAISLFLISILLLFLPQLERILRLEKLLSKFKTWG